MAKRGIQKRVVSTILIVGVLPLLLGIYLIYLGGKRVLTDSIGANFQEIARETADKIDIIIGKEVSEVKNLSVSPDIIAVVTDANRHPPNILNNNISDHLRNLTNYEREYSGIYVTNEKGLLVAATSLPVRQTGKGDDYHQADEAWWQFAYNAGKGETYISDIYLSEDEDSYLMDIAVPILSVGAEAEKKVLGVIRVIYKVDQIFKVIADVKIDNTGHANLVSSDGVIVICPIFPPKSHSIGQELMERIAKREPSWDIAEDDAHGGENSIIGFAPVRFPQEMGIKNFGGKDWHIFIRQHPSETYAPIHSLFLKVLISGLILIGILSVMGFYGAKKIVKPILLLHKGAELIGQGNLDHRLNIRTGDEIGDLSEAFNRMAIKLKEYSESLESRVMERTRELRESEEQYKNLFDHAEDSMLMLDLTGKIVAVNKRQEEVIGYPKDTLLGQEFSLILPKEGREIFADFLERALKGEKPPTIEVEIPNHEGGLLTMEMDLTGIKKDESIAFVQVHLRDITKRKELEQQVIQAEKLAATGQLIGGIAHELNNPLGGILNCISNMKKKSLPQTRQEEYLNLIEDGVNRVQKIVTQLLDFSQQHEPELTPIDVNSIIKHILSLLSYTFNRTGIKLDENLAPNLPLLMLDRHKMEQALINLFLNAIQAINGKGRIAITTWQKGAWCFIEISDTGCGIPPHILSKIFDPFFTTKGVGKGTGLGLSVTKGIIVKHSGEIEVKSKVGEGTTFTIKLPVGL